ncbi:MAG: glutamate synthase-related protein [Anaerolineaceae bacterium]|nr:glutamate synthase-related protein [Anaerolineaceae bacterium]MDE0329960.1 glutamate synthase-related protein [Anaerolineaceae bacterium]
MNSRRQSQVNSTGNLHPLDRDERDACALICAVRKGAEATHGNVKRTIEALARMGHRTGYIDGEGDGVGILTDIPRQLWTRKLAKVGLRSSLASSSRFWVAHVFIPTTTLSRAEQLVEKIIMEITAAGLETLLDMPGQVDSNVLGRNAEKSAPIFWQIAGVNGKVARNDLEATLFGLKTRLESELDIHFPSFSSHSVVYKMQGTVEILRRYYPELRDPDYASTVTLGHARYSTNTNPVFERAQPFDLLGHNGEFNTISRFRMEAAMLGIELNSANSDSQDVDRAISALCHDFGLDLIEAMELVFPPFEHDLIRNSPEIRSMYQQMRNSFGPFAQGPSAVVARLGEMAVFSVDALGLRPLWFGDTEKEYFVSSERGVYPLDMMSSDPRPLAPGEKIALRIEQGRGIEVLDYPAIQRHVLQRFRSRGIHFSWMSGRIPALLNSNGQKGQNGLSENGKRLTGTNGDQPVPVEPQSPVIAVVQPTGINPADAAGTAVQVQTLERKVATGELLPWMAEATPVNLKVLAAMGWERYHTSLVDSMVDNEKEQIGSLGWDGPLAAMSRTRSNMTDFFKETVAVVTNPSIDRERERSQFSTRVLLGARPNIGQAATEEDRLLELETPMLVGGHPGLAPAEVMREVAKAQGTCLLEDICDHYGEAFVRLPLVTETGESVEEALKRFQQGAIDAVRSGTRCLLLDDEESLAGDGLWVDPALATAAVDKALREAPDTPNLRRRTGIILRSGALRCLHDLALCTSLGANAIAPYAIYAVALKRAPRPSRKPLGPEEQLRSLNATVRILTAGLQKVTSTIGCHELRGYGHSFSSVGLSDSVAELFGTPNYFGSAERGLTWAAIQQDAEARASDLRGDTRARLANADRFYPKMWKKAESVAHGELSLEEYTEVLLNLEDTIPIAVRHTLGLKESSDPVDPQEVDTTVSGKGRRHSMPVLITAMSFGSQGELAYRAYAEAAKRLDILCVNGEGGELPELMGLYPHNRGQQVASARFGVNVAFLNSTGLIEIKIGQGAKPGEGGHLPGFKVTEQVAAARQTVPGVGLISPSNNHDLYSIEDLAQLIDELKTANTNSRISVKIPVVPGVGIIAVGIAKAGADIIALTGYEGGTGAARAHALRYVGLPVEIGLWLTHRALIESGLRDRVELWCDGGMKSGRDVVKMMCLGSDRVGFATLAMVAMGCTICRKCQEGTCHVGITTHIKTKEEAKAQGLPSFQPRDYEAAVTGICNVFDMLAEDIRKWTARLGMTRTQDLVGRVDLLTQTTLQDRLDLDVLMEPVPAVKKTRIQKGVGRLITRPRNTLSKQITQELAENAALGFIEMTYDDEGVMASDRALGTHLCGALKRGFPNAHKMENIHLSFSNSAIAGNGLGAFTDAPVNILVEGGAQDGVAKCARGGNVTILKGLNHNGRLLDGSVGKSFAYGAQGGFFIVQGCADTRACIRFSGADVVFGGELGEPLRDDLGGIGARAHLKGYAFEYMTSGRALVLGDPGPWICAGMTGGVIYQRIQPEMNLTVEAIRSRIAPGASVDIYSLDETGTSDVQEMLGIYIKTLEDNRQADAVQHLYNLKSRPQDYFIRIAPLLHEPEQ